MTPIIVQFIPAGNDAGANKAPIYINVNMILMLAPARNGTTTITFDSGHTEIVADPPHVNLDKIQDAVADDARCRALEATSPAETIPRAWH